MKEVLKNLVDQGLLKEEKGIGFDQIKKRLDRAIIDLGNAKLLLNKDETGAYRMAYDAMLQAGLSLILSYGFRPNIKNFHKTVVGCVREIFGKEYLVLIKKFDQMRKSRNEAIYDVAAISQAEADESIKTAKKLIEAIIKRVKKRNPQKELLQ